MKTIMLNDDQMLVKLDFCEISIIKVFDDENIWYLDFLDINENIKVNDLMKAVTLLKEGAWVLGGEKVEVHLDTSHEKYDLRNHVLRELGFEVQQDPIMTYGGLIVLEVCNEG